MEQVSISKVQVKSVADGMSSSEKTNHISNEYFPNIDPGLTVCGDNILIMSKFTPSKTQGGIILTDSIRIGESYAATIGKIIQLGPLAYRDRQNHNNHWSEGNWAEEGTFVFVPKVGTRITKTVDGETYDFVVIKDQDVMAVFHDLTGYNQFL